jgi:hypothetical protein
MFNKISLLKGCKVKYIFIVVFLLFAVGFVSAIQYNKTNVTFSGSFGAGKTLETDWYKIENGSFYGKNAYPIIDPVKRKREKVCTVIFKEKRKRFCERKIVGYKNKTKRLCHRENRKRVCERVTYQIPIKKRVCHIDVYQKPYKRCKYMWVSKDHKIGCLNPRGVYTNAVLLENFDYKIDGGWQKLQPEPNKTRLQNKSVKFRVVIPSNCTPKYEINKAVIIEEILP